MKVPSRKTRNLKVQHNEARKYKGLNHKFQAIRPNSLRPKNLRPANNIMNSMIFEP